MAASRAVFPLLACVLGAAGSIAGENDGPAGHWKLAGDARDSAAGHRDAKNHGVRFTAKGPDGKSAAAAFDGRSAYLEVKPDPRLSPGAGNFTLALWVNAPAHSQGGDLITLFDPAKRIGFNLSLQTNPGTTGTANLRQLQFGIDAGSQPHWTDEDRPGAAILGFAMAAHEGQLFVGTADNAPGGVGHVYRFARTGEWVDCGAPDKCNAVTSLTAFEGRLYAATGKYRFAGSALKESDNKNLGGKVFRYEGQTRWAEAGRLPGVEAVAGMVVFRGKLYASSLYKPAGFFRLESDGKWASLPVPNGKRVESMAVFDDALWATSYDGGRIYRYDGAKWEDLGRLGDNTQTYSFAIHHGQLCVGTWPSGKVYRRVGDQWEDMGRLGEEREVMGMLVHNGKLYGGSLPLAAVFRHDGKTTWTRTSRLDTTPDVKYRRVWTMAEHNGRLFCTTLPSGKVHSMETGPCTTFDREFPTGWQHVVAIKQGGLLRLYVNGKRVAESRRFDPKQFNLANESSLRIGAGSGAFFHGSLADVRIHHRALSEAEIKALAHR